MILQFLTSRFKREFLGVTMTKLWRILLYWYPGSNFALFQSTFLSAVYNMQ